MKVPFVRDGLGGLIGFVARHHGKVLLLSVLLTIAAVVVILLRFDIRSDLKDLMPENSRSVRDTFAIADRMGSVTSLTIIVEVPERTLAPGMLGSASYEACVAENSGDPLVLIDDAPGDAEEVCGDPLVLFARDLTAALQAMDTIGYAHFHNDKRFFEENILLYASVEDLEALYEELDTSLTDARRQSGEYKACLLTATQAGECDALEPGLKKRSEEGAEAEEVDLSEGGLRERLGARYATSELASVPTYPVYQLPDGAWIIRIQVRFRDASTSLKATQSHLEEIEALVARLGPERYHREMRIAYGGGFKTQQGEYESIVNDILVSGGTTVGGILLLLFVFFRRVRVAFIVVLPLAMAIAWTLALAFLTIGYLNLITAFIFAILLGLGIDFGIHVLARYDEERLRGRDAEQAMRVSVIEVGSANFAGGMTTAATFFTLLLAEFRGFSQFGLVAGLGVLISLFAMLSVLPALVLTLQRLLPTTTKVKEVHEPPSTLTLRWSRWVAVALVLAAGSFVAFSVVEVDEVQFEENFYRLRMRQSAYSQESDRYGVTEKRHSSPALVLLDSLEEVSALERILTQRRDPHMVFNLREVARLYPNLFGRLNAALAFGFALSGEVGTAPTMATARRVLPTSFARTIPSFVRYDVDGSAALRQVVAFTREYPTLSRLLVEDVWEVPLAQVRAYAVWRPILHQHARLPGWLHAALPSQRDNQRISSVRSFVSVYSFMPGTPSEQAAKLAIIAQMEERTRDRNIRFLPTDEKEQIQSLRRYLVQDSIGVDDLPDWVKRQFKEGGLKPAAPRPGSGVDYAFGNVALVYQSTSTLNGLQAHRFTDEMRTIRVNDKPLVMSANAFVFADMLTQIKKDGAEVVLIAGLIVLLVVALQHRSLLQTVVICAPLVVALTWIAGIMALFHLKLGFFNMVILPVIIGIGIDGSIHLFHRYRSVGRGGLLVAMRHAGGAIFMSAATTCVGFSGMMMSQHQGLNTMGQLAVIGISSAWLATMTVQPALIILAEWLGLKGIVPGHDYVAPGGVVAAAALASGADEEGGEADGAAAPERSSSDGSV